MQITAATFTRRQRVRTLAFAGARFEPDWREKATIIGEHPVDGVNVHERGWYVIRLDDGGTISSHASRLMADNEPPFVGRLPSYASTQR